MSALPTALYIYICVVSAVLGACMGSFLNCFAWRIVHGESVLRGRSHCDLCGHVLGIRDLVPVVSFLAHRGKCRYCGAKLSARHVWAELITAAVYAVTVIHYGITLQALEGLILSSILLVCTFADLEGYIIPDRCIIAGLVVHLVFMLFSGNFVALLVQGLIGGFAVAGVLLAVVLVMEKILKREAMGGGDLKLLFLTGFVMGWQKNILCLLTACILGMVFALAYRKLCQDEDGAFPWGPSIALAAWLTQLWGGYILDWYLGLF